MACHSALKQTCSESTLTHAYPRPHYGKIKAAACGPDGRLRTVVRSVTCCDVRYRTTACIFKNPKQHQSDAHLASRERHDSRR